MPLLTTLALRRLFCVSGPHHRRHHLLTNAEHTSKRHRVFCALFPNIYATEAILSSDNLLVHMPCSFSCRAFPAGIYIYSSTPFHMIFPP